MTARESPCRITHSGRKRTPHTYSERLALLRESLRRRRIPGFLVTDLNNVRYLSGFTGSSGLLFITGTERVLVTDFRYMEQSAHEVPDWEMVIEKYGRIKTIESLVQRTGIRSLGIEASVSYQFFQELGSSPANIRAYAGLVEEFRKFKDAFETRAIRNAVRRAERAFRKVKPRIRHGVREQEIAWRLEDELKKLGCRKIPFDIIVASGRHSAMPHAHATEKRLHRGDLLIIDWGGESCGYFSDMTRTFLLKGGAHVSRKKEIYGVVLDAQKKALTQIASGMKSRDIDRNAREVIRASGYGDYFGHGTGHGIGVQVHEAPRIGWDTEDRVGDRMIFTVEPGIYLPGIGGVRIEDMVMMKAGKPVVLTSLPKRLEVVGK
jgi:Xaa-Pro aminopeptidase